MLLIVFLFNVGGYYIVFWGLRLQADKQLTTRLDADLYKTNETIELKIPVTLPYAIHQQEFQRIDGRFEHHGEFFKLVKHKLLNDTLYIICIRDHQTKHLVNTMTDYVKLTQALPATSQKALNFLSKLLTDFYSQADIGIVHNYGFSMVILFKKTSDPLPEPVIPVHSPPPKV